MSISGNSHLLTAPEVAARIGKTARHVRRLADQGKLPIAQRLPGKTGAILFEAEAVEALVARDEAAEH